MKLSKDFSIEYAHIYTNNKIGKEQETSMEVLGQLYKEEDTIGQTRSLVIMIDDYSFPDPSFNYDEFSKWLGAKGFQPDFMIRESELIPLCDHVLALIIDSKLREQISDYIRAKKKYPCSLFVATWYLLRLGYVSASIFSDDLVAAKLINILPVSFKPFEEKALEIISLTQFSEAVNQIEYRYLEGRMTA